MVFVNDEFDDFSFDAVLQLTVLHLGYIYFSLLQVKVQICTRKSHKWQFTSIPFMA